jgi:hypothetical protein
VLFDEIREYNRALNLAKKPTNTHTRTQNTLKSKVLLSTETKVKKEHTHKSPKLTNGLMS